MVNKEYLVTHEAKITNVIFHSLGAHVQGA